MGRRPPRSPLFPCATLFRSVLGVGDVAVEEGLGGAFIHETARNRSEEHTSELQSLRHLVCRLLLEKKPPAVAQPAQRSARPCQGCDPPATHAGRTCLDPATPGLGLLFYPGGHPPRLSPFPSPTLPA